MMSQVLRALALVVVLAGVAWCEFHPIDVEPMMKKEQADFEVSDAHIIPGSIT